MNYPPLPPPPKGTLTWITNEPDQEQKSPDPEDVFSDWLMDIFRLNANRTAPLRRGE